MTKRIKSTRTISAKRNSNYEIRKEHVEYSDGTTEDKIMCYSLAGKPLGGIMETERLFRNKVTGPVVVVKSVPDSPIIDDSNITDAKKKPVKK